MKVTIKLDTEEFREQMKQMIYPADSFSDSEWSVIIQQAAKQVIATEAEKIFQQLKTLQGDMRAAEQTAEHSRQLLEAFFSRKGKN